MHLAVIKSMNTSISRMRASKIPVEYRRILVVIFFQLRVFLSGLGLSVERRLKNFFNFAVKEEVFMDNFTPSVEWGEYCAEKIAAGGAAIFE